MMYTYIIQTFWANKVYTPGAISYALIISCNGEQFMARCQAQPNGSYFTLLNSRAGAYIT